MIQNKSPVSAPSSAKVPPEQLTILIFKDNYAARTFKVPLKWLSQFGMALGALTLACAASLGLAIRYYAVARLEGVKSSTPPGLSPPPVTSPTESANASRVAELEQKVRELQASLELEARNLATSSAQGRTGADESSANPPAIVPPGTKSLSPASALGLSSRLFEGLPSAAIQSGPDDPSGIPIRLHAPQAVWHGNTLQVHLFIQYMGPGKGKVEGRFILLARGPSALLAYPGHVFKSAGQDSLIDINHGEHFGVSRFREVKATFGPVPSRDWLKEIEFVAVSDTSQLLIHQRIDLSLKPVAYSGSAGPRPAALKPDENPVASTPRKSAESPTTDDSETKEEK